MVDFCGWSMPLHYGSQLEEHLAVRRDCGMFDISHLSAIDVAGVDALVYLQRLLANDIAKRVPGRALYSCMLNEAGNVLDDLIVYDLGDLHYRLVGNAVNADKDLVWMRTCLADWQCQVTLTPRHDLAMLAVQGPKARERVWQALPGCRKATVDLGYFQAAVVDELLIARTGYTGEDGFEISLPGAAAQTLWQSLLEQGVRPCGLGARDTLRVEAGMNLYGQDMDETVSPLDAGLGWTVDFSDARNFVGKSALLLDKPQQWQLLGLILLEPGVLRTHQAIFTQHGAGLITSGTFSPTLHHAIALARLPLGVAAGDSVKVAIREKHCAAAVVKPPFVRNGNILINLDYLNGIMHA